MTLDDPIAARGYLYKHGDRPLDGYTIQRAAGRGGFGEVYYAISDSGREVALKVVNTYEQIELRGISQCMNLKSPHLVTIFDVKYGNDGKPWVVMEYVGGPSLAELVAAAPMGLGPAKAAFFLREIGKGLTYLHDCGIVHRDLKPGNIFYENGYVKIGDYGLSKSMSVTRHSGQTVAVGTLHYMAPEIGDGRYDRSIDIYALGALLFEMLTGQVPFYGSSPAEVLMKHLTTQVNVETIEEPFRSVVRKAMAKNPADRYQSVQEMVEAVFGSEDIRNSVTAFQPASLTMVAGQAAKNIGSGPPPSWKPPQPPTPRQAKDPWTDLGDKINSKFDNVSEKFNRAAEKIGQKWERKWNKYDRPRPEPAPGAYVADWCAVRDTMPTPARFLFAGMVMFLACFVAAANTSQPYATEMFWRDWMAIVGAVVGALIAWRWVAPSVVNETKWLRCIAVGLPAAFGAALCTFPFWINNSHVFVSMEALFVALALVHWSKRLETNRRHRFNIGLLVTCAIGTAIVSGMFDLNDDFMIGNIAAVVGSTLAVSLIAPWDRYWRGRPVFIDSNARSSPMPPPPVPPIPPINPATDPADVPPPIPQPDAAANPPRPNSAQAKINFPFDTRRPRNFVPAIVIFCVIFFLFSHSIHGGIGVVPLAPIIACLIAFTIIRNTLRRNNMATYASTRMYPAESWSVGGAVFGFTRFVFSVAGGITLVASLILAVAAVSNLPGLFASGVLDPRMPADISRQMGTSEWPHLFREIGGVASTVLLCASVVLLSIARRAGGGFHIVRGIAGILILFVAAISFGHAIPNWQSYVPTHDPAASFDQVFNHMDTHKTVSALLIAAAGYTLLLWPPRRRFLQAPVDAGAKS